MKKNVVIGISVLMGLIALPVMAAKEITFDQVDAMKLKKIATVSTTAQATSPMDAKRNLSQLADEQGGRYYVIVTLREHGKVNATANVYN